MGAVWISKRASPEGPTYGDALQQAKGLGGALGGTALGGLAGAGAGIGGLGGAIGGGLHGLFAPGKDEEGKKRNPLVEALKRALGYGALGGIAGGVALPVGGALGGAAGLGMGAKVTGLGDKTQAAKDALFPQQAMGAQRNISTIPTAE
jgi:hypothetical protein